MGIRIQPTEVCVPKENPFENDHISREQTAKVLTRFIEKIDGPGVLAIDASWGAGKTTFLRMWKQYLHNEQFPVVMFNAWENDFSGDPFVSLTAELTKGLSGYGEAVQPKIERLKNLSKLIPGSVRIASSLIPVIGSQMGEVLASAAEHRLRDYWDAKDSVVSFRISLQDTANTLSESRENHPLVVIIDELDRCRPTYAIELLETAKHLFNVDNIVFVLGINIVELSHSIRTLYGSEFDAEGYLRRFIDLDFPLSDPNSETVSNNTLSRTKFINEILSTIHFDERTHELLVKSSKAILRYFFNHSYFSLRRIAQALLRLGAVLELLHLPEQNLAVTQEICVLLIIRTLDKNLYLRFVNGEATDLEVAEEVLKRLGIQRRDVNSSSGRDYYGATLFESLLILYYLAKRNYENNSYVEWDLSSSDLYRWHERNQSDTSVDEAEKSYSTHVTHYVVQQNKPENPYGYYWKWVGTPKDVLNIAYELLEFQSHDFYRSPEQ
ncbi:MAG: P-loop NTPase fold protein [Chloroflexi bacterium]|nr:P-loop NTPase fold protein [Chloroflexota bacterium]